MSESTNVLKEKLGKALAQLPYLPRVLALVWRVARPWTIGWLALLVLQGLLPAGVVYLTKLVVDGLVTVAKAGGSWPNTQAVLVTVALLGTIMLLAEAARSATSWIRAIQADLLQDHINDLIHAKSVAADLAFYEFPDYYDHLHRARAEATYRPAALLDNLGGLFQNSITLVAMGAILVPLGPWLSVALLVSTLPAFFVVIRYSLVQYHWRQRTTADERRARYYDWLMSTAEAAAEIRLFRLGPRFQSAYQNLRRRLRRERLRLSGRQSIAELLAGTVALLVTGAAMIWMVWKATRGLVTLGDLALIYAAFNQGQRLMRTLIESVGQLYANTLFVGDLFEFLALEPLIKEPSSEEAKTPRNIIEEISFRQVSFRYQESERKALDEFNLTIRGGQIAAIVGPNGAGKSTLIKLLCRFYDPESGKIELNGLNLREIETRKLRRLVTALFQQPVHYNVDVRANVEYGDLESDPDESQIRAALVAAGAEEIVSRLPHGPETLLGRWFNGGTELSVGEWQRIALARAFLRQAPIMILDEPTSALDPWAEADWLQRFRQLAVGRTAIVITHRLSTAMQADVIHVMDRGRIVESGSHAELLEQNGLYAESWGRQSSENRVELEPAKLLA